MPMPLVPGEAEPEEEDIGGRGEEDWCVGGEMRRPMNAFFIFCKRHRSVVRERYPHLENRSITKILGEWWATLESDEKNTYTELAKQVRGWEAELGWAPAVLMLARTSLQTLLGMC